MKKIVILLFVFISALSIAQTFEGEIVYTINWKSKTDQITDEQWKQMMGTKMNYFIKKGNYKSVTNGSMSQWQMYLQKTNLLYSKLSIESKLKTTDASVNADEILKSEIKKDVCTILDYSCDELTLTCKSGVQKYYYTNQLPVDPKLYEKHKYANWYAYLSISNALPLKMLIENDQFVMETTVKEVKQRKLRDGFFNLSEAEK